MSDDVDALLEEERFFRRRSEASPEVQAWCRHFLEGGALRRDASLDARAGWLLAAQAPAHLRRNSERGE
jgi:hypothetical protein